MPMKLAALVFQRKVIVFVRNESLVKDPQSLARWLVTPQLMGSAVRRQRYHHA